MTAPRMLVRLVAVPIAIATLSLMPALAADEATMTNPG